MSVADLHRRFIADKYQQLDLANPQDARQIRDILIVTFPLNADVTEDYQSTVFEDGHQVVEGVSMSWAAAQFFFYLEEPEARLARGMVAVLCAVDGKPQHQVFFFYEEEENAVFFEVSRQVWPGRHVGLLVPTATIQQVNEMRDGLQDELVAYLLESVSD